jgi:hypothetical protein
MNDTSRGFDEGSNAARGSSTGSPARARFGRYCFNFGTASHRQLACGAIALLF